MPVPGRRVVERVAERGRVGEWPTPDQRDKGGFWKGPILLQVQGIDFNLRYIGIHDHRSRGVFPLHVHPHAEFLFTLEGRGTIFAPDRGLEVDCRPGQLVAVPPFLGHGSRWVVPRGGRWRLMAVDFDMHLDASRVLAETVEPVDMAMAPFYEWMFLRAGMTLNWEEKEEPGLFRLFRELQDKVAVPGYGVGADAVALVIRMISMFSRSIRGAGLADGRGLLPLSRHKEAAILRARILIEQGERPDAGLVARIAEAVGMTESHLIREFKKLHGTTPKQYHLQVVMKRASALLAGTGMSVKEVAYSLGYEDPATFSRSFSRVVGMNPMAYAGVHRAIPQG